MTLRHTEMLIIPGTGLLTDAWFLTCWGPYSSFKWSLLAKICRCKLVFVSVGAGPIKSAAGRWLVKSALSLADFRSYRDNSTVQCLNGIGFRTDNDRAYPDLVFSLPESATSQRTERRQRTVVGLGLMAYSGQPGHEQNGILEQNNATRLAYLESLANLTVWLLARENDVRLLIGDLADVSETQEFKCLLRKRLSVPDGAHISVSGEAHIIDEPILSVKDLLSQIAATDIVVATRFHNVVLALLCEKPVISISFHHKCESLMSAMGLSAYCLNINDLNADQSIERISDLKINAARLKPLIREKNSQFRKALDEQYRLIFNDTWPE
jgi:polysaccharide pyruvyl transferase WcaK-like protein